METQSSQTEGHRQAILEGLAFLSRIFWGPDLESCEAMIRGNCLQPFEILSPPMSFDPPGTIAEIAGLISQNTDPHSLLQTLEESYVRLFISNRGGITSLYQSCYTNPEWPEKPGPLMGAAALDMQRRLKSAGLSLDEKLGQLPDHLSVEIEYLYFLLQEPENREDNRSAVEARAFAAEVMLPWVRKFRKKLEGEEENRFYLRITGLLVSLLTLISGS